MHDAEATWTMNLIHSGVLHQWGMLCRSASAKQSWWSDASGKRWKKNETIAICEWKDGNQSVSWILPSGNLNIFKIANWKITIYNEKNTIDGDFPVRYVTNYQGVCWSEMLCVSLPSRRISNSMEHKSVTAKKVLMFPFKYNSLHFRDSNFLTSYI